MNTAFNLTREAMHYRHGVFSAGLRAVGYEVRGNDPGGLANCRPGDVLLIWNRYGPYHDAAMRFENRGGTVLVAENGYLRGPKDGGDYYALARRAHNGAGEWAQGGPHRWNALGIELKPWRTDGGHVLICPNRSFGMPGLAMPLDWANDAYGRLKRVTKRELRIRPHPGNNAPAKPLAEDLAGAWCVIVWASSAGVHSLIAGVPVICESPWWICKAAAGVSLRLESPDMPERLPAFQRLAFAQWSLREIESGDAFRSLLCPAREGEVAARA